MKSLRKNLVGILTIALFAGVTAQLSRANTDPPARDFLTGKWEGVQQSNWYGEARFALQYDTLTQNITGSGTVFYAEIQETVRTVIKGELKNDSNVRLNIHYERFAVSHDIIFDLTYDNGTLVGSGMNYRGVSVTLKLKKVD